MVRLSEASFSVNGVRASLTTSYLSCMLTSCFYIQDQELDVRDGVDFYTASTLLTKASRRR